MAPCHFGNVEFAELIELGQRLVGAARFFFIDAADGEADMDEDVLADLGFGHVVQAGLAGDAAELHARHVHAFVGERFNHLARNC